MALKFFICVLACIIAKTAGQIVSTAVSVADVCPDVTKDGPHLFCTDKNACLSTGVVICEAVGVGYIVPCPPEKPYCTFIDGTPGKARPGICSATKPEKQSMADTDDKTCASVVDPKKFICTGPGFIPDPTDCRKYHFCEVDAGILKGYDLECRSGMMYNPITSSCDIPYTAAKCLNVNCTAIEKFSRIYYGTSKQYYVQCAEGPGKVDVPIMFSCPLNTIAEIQIFPVNCAYSCKRAGFFANSLSPKEYFECYYEALVWKNIEHTCFGDKKFVENTTNPAKFECR